MPNFCSSTVRFQPTMSIHHGSTSGCHHPPICRLGLLCDHGLNGGYRFRLGHRCTFGQHGERFTGPTGGLGPGSGPWRLEKIGALIPSWIIFLNGGLNPSPKLNHIFQMGYFNQTIRPRFCMILLDACFWLDIFCEGHEPLQIAVEWYFFLLLHINFNGIIVLECPRLFHRHVGATCWCQVSWKPQVIYPLKGKVSSCICIFISFDHMEW